MDRIEPQWLQAQLEALSDAELASVIIEFAGPAAVALALGEETYRRLTTLRQAIAATRSIQDGQYGLN